MDTVQSEKFLTKPLLVVFLTIVIDLIGFGMVIPLLKFYAERFDASSLTVGMLMAVYSLMQFIFAPIFGSISDRHGRRPVLFFSIVGAGIGYMTVGLAGSLLMIFVGRIIGGITAANLSTAQAYIADVTSREHRAKGMGLFGMAFGLGFVLGPALAGVLSHLTVGSLLTQSIGFQNTAPTVAAALAHLDGPGLPFFVASSMSFVNAALVYLFLPETVVSGRERPELKRNRFAELLSAVENRKQALVVVQYILLITAFSMMNVAFPYFTDLNYGFKETETGYLLAYVGVLAAVVQGGLFAKLAKHLGEAKLVVIGSLMLALGLLLLPEINRATGLVFLLIGTGVFAVGNSVASPALTSLASKSTSDSDQGKMMGVMQSGASLARVIGPAICGVLLTTANNETNRDTLRRSMWVASLIMLLTVAVSIYGIVSGIHVHEREAQ